MADDAILHVTASNPVDLAENLQNTLDTSTSWYNDNKLMVNGPKCNVSVISSNHKKINEPIDVKVNSQILTQTSNFKHLGIQIDQHLQWNEQITALAKVVAPKLHVLRKIAKFVPESLLSRIYKSCIQPHAVLFGVICHKIRSIKCSIYKTLQQELLKAILILLMLEVLILSKV